MSFDMYQRNAQAVKVILSEMYISWASSDKVIMQIESLVEDMRLAAQQQPMAPNGAASNAAAAASRVPSLVASSAISSPLRHSDPHKTSSTGEANGDGRAPSPPPSPPIRQVGKKSSSDDPRSASPGQMGRYFNVDELDYPHRGSSPGATGAATSGVVMHSKPVVVDPMAPLPHGAVGGGTPMSHSPQSSHSKSPPSQSPGASGTLGALDITMEAPMVNVELLPPPENSTASVIGRFVSRSGSFATQPPSNIPIATTADIPVFYNKRIARGICPRDEVPTDELEALQAYFAVKGNGAPSAGTKTVKVAADADAAKTVWKWEFEKLCKSVFNVPVWMKDHLFKRIAATYGVAETNSLTEQQITDYYRSKMAHLSINRRYFELIAPDSSATYLVQEDFKRVTKYLVDCHPGLEFLKQPEFQEYYCRTVAIRIVYMLENRQNGKVSWPNFDRSDLPQIMRKLDDTPDINHVLQYFSYEHFYVLYCRFWELDTDRDQLISLDNLCNYSQGLIIPTVLKRVIEGAGRPLSSTKPGKIDFEDFVYFCLSEEDKNSDPAVYYWFRLLDTDGDGILSGYELGQFYEENRQRFLDFTCMDDAELRYDDMMCQMLDMLGKPILKDKSLGVTLADLRSCPTPSHFFDMIFNATKFMAFEHRDPFLEHHQKSWPEKNDWDRFARAEYDRMSSEAY